MRGSGWPVSSARAAALAVVIVAAAPPAEAQTARIEPVTDAELQDPSPDEWLMWRRTLDSWGFRNVHFVKC